MAKFEDLETLRLEKEEFELMTSILGLEYQEAWSGRSRGRLRGRAILPDSCRSHEVEVTIDVYQLVKEGDTYWFCPNYEEATHFRIRRYADIHATGKGSRSRYDRKSVYQITWEHIVSLCCSKYKES